MQTICRVFRLLGTISEEDVVGSWSSGRRRSCGLRKTQPRWNSNSRSSEAGFADACRSLDSSPTSLDRLSFGSHFSRLACPRKFLPLR